MLIKRKPDTYEKLHILGGMATDDILSDSHSRRRGTYRGPYSSRKKNPIPGVYRASMPNGKHINLFRVMFTDFCKMDCHFCPNSHWVPRKRHAFKIDELAKAFMELHQRHTVDGLFLSSGVAGTGSKTTERLVRVVEIIRKKYNFKGYVHLKVMPGTERQYVEAAHELGTRLSINMETPTLDHMKKLSKMKDLQHDILSPMEWINDLTRSSAGGAVGQATQLVVGAADESDVDILDRVDQLYDEWNLKRVYYAPFHPSALHPPGGAPRHASHAQPPPIPDGLATTHLRLPQGRNRPRLRQLAGFLPSGVRPKDLHSPRKRRSLSRRRQCRQPRHGSSESSRHRPISLPDASSRTDDATP